MRKLTLFIGMACSFLTGYGQYLAGEQFVDAQEIPALVKQLNGSLSGSRKAAVLLKIGYGYLYKPGENKADVDSALDYARKAATYSLQIKHTAFMQEAFLLASLAYMEQKNKPAATSLLPVMNDSTRLKMLLCLSLLNHHTKPTPPGDRSHLDSAAYYAQEALRLSARIKLRRAETLLRLEQVAKDYYNQHYNTQSEKCYLLLQAYVDGASSPSKARVLISLSSIYTDEGNFYKATSYGIQAEKALNRNSSDADYAFVYLNLGGLCALESKYEQSMAYYGYILANPKRYALYASIYGLVNSCCNSLRKMNRNDEVIPYLQKFRQRYPEKTDLDRSYSSLALGNAYREMKQFELSEKNYLEAIRYVNLAGRSPAVMYSNLGVLYNQFNKHAKALEALKVAEKELATMNEIVIASNYSYIAQSEAALNNYEGAYRYLVKSKVLSDSIFVASKAKATQELEVQYQTEKKEADLQLKEEKIRFLNQNAVLMQQEAKLQDAKLTAAALLTRKNEVELALKRKDMEALTQQSKFQQATIEQADARRTITILVIALLAVIIALLCWLFWWKLKSNKVITDKNALLQQLVKDKSWLLKEMHHRVKNNLHTIMNLLEFQSAYLQDGALDAIKNSQSRIFSMSLIHQKLYQTEETKIIDMAYYVPELVAYLRESFGMQRQFHIGMDIDHTAFQVEEAVPLGLIINEAVTNSLKYAFTDARQGEIRISLKASGVDEYELIIADNGIGLSEGFDIDNAPSLGFQLIKGLSEQLDAELCIVNEQGLKVILSGISVRRTVKVKAMEKELKEQMAI